jgi:IMP dehydrogenase
MARKIIDPNPGLSRRLQEYILLPGKIPSGFSTENVDLSTPLTKFKGNKKPKIKLNLPILSAPMQAVTGPEMAIEMANLGGAGVIYCSQSITTEANMVRRVKSHKAGFVVPDVFSPDTLIGEVQERIEVKGYSTFPITADGKSNGKLVGYLTRKDFDQQLHSDLKIEERMIPKERVSFALLDDVSDEDGELDLNKALGILRNSHHGSLPILDDGGRLCYVVFRKDVEEHLRNPLELVDSTKRFICGAAINTHDYRERVKAVVDAGVDFLVIDTSQAYSDYVQDCLHSLKGNFKDTPVIAGNIVTREGFDFLVENGADSVKVGMGSGSICITQEQINIGRGQATAVIEVSNARDELQKETDVYVPIISDGGVSRSADMTMALGLGADSVMVGRFVVGSEESNSARITRNMTVDGRTVQEIVKEYWGEGSNRARKWSRFRYDQASFEEGIEIYVPYVGPLRDYILPSMTMLRDGVRKAGCRNIEELHKNSVVQVLSWYSLATRLESPSIVPQPSKSETKSV